MSEPTPEAVGAVARVLATPAPKRYLSTQPTNEEHHARAVMDFLRDAIHKGTGPEPSAIRESLGLEWEVEFSSLGTQERIVGQWQETSL